MASSFMAGFDWLKGATGSSQQSTTGMQQQQAYSALASSATVKALINSGGTTQWTTSVPPQPGQTYTYYFQGNTATWTTSLGNPPEPVVDPISLIEDPVQRAVAQAIKDILAA